MQRLRAFIAILAVVLHGADVVRAQSTAAPDTTAALSSIADPTANKLAFDQQPTSTVAGATITPAVTVRTNPTVSGVSISLAISSGTGSLSGTKTRTTNASGVATFNDLSINLTGSKRLQAAAQGYSSITSSSFNITVGSAVRLRIQTEPSATATAGVAFAQQPILYVEDAGGNRVTTDNSTVVTAVRFAGDGTLQGTLTATASSGIVTFSNLSHNVANTISIRFSGGALVPDTSRTIVVSPASAARLVFVQQPTDAAVGAVIAPAVTAALRDAFGNAVTTSGTSVTLALASGTGVLSGTLTRSTSSGVATFSNLSVNLAGSKTLRATSGSLTAAVSNAFIISAGVAKTLAFVQQPTNAVAATPISPAVTVQVRDSLGNAVAKSGIGITLGLLSGTGTLSGTTTVSTDASGLASFADLSINLIGAKTLSAVSAGLTAASSSSFTITAGAAARLEITQQPTETAAGALMSPAVTVQIKDAQGNIVRSAGTTVGIAMTDGTGTLTGTLSQLTDASGLATFGNLSVNLTGSKQFTASSAGLVSAVSSAFTIRAAPANKLLFTANPGGGVAGTAFSIQPVVSLMDAYGNVVSGMAQTVTLSIQNNAGPGGTLLGTKSVAVNQQTGQATFADIAIDKAGNGYTLTATGSTLSMTPGNVVSIPFSVTSGAAVKVRVENAADGSGVIIASQNVTSGTSIALYAIARDSYDNFVSNVAATSWAFVQYTGGVATTDLAASDDKKSAVFTGKLAGTATIMALASGLSSVATGTLTVVVAGSATQVRIESAANGTGVVISDRTLASGSPLTVYAIGRDAGGNFISNLAAGTWSLQNKTGGVSDSNLVASADRKSAVFTGKSVGSARIRATSGTLTAGTSGILTVEAGPATSIVSVAGTPQSVPVGTAFPVRLSARVRDAAGNPAKGIYVIWTPPASGPSGTFAAGGSAATTDSTGLATSGIFTANAVSGSYAVTATLPLGVSITSFLLTNTFGVAARIGTAAGSPQSTKVMTRFATPLAAIVTDSSGNAVGGVFVTFVAPSSGPSGTFPGDSLRAVVSTSSTGIATAPAFVANANVGSYQIMATAPGVAAGTPFELTNTAGSPGTIMAAAGTPQSAIVGSPYAINLKAVVKDSAGNALPRVLVTFTAPSSGASGRFAEKLIDSVFTDTTGGAIASQLTANAIVGSFTVIARAQGVAATAGYALTNQPALVDTFLIDAAGGGKIGNQAVRVPFAIRIRATDDYGNIATSFTGTANLSSNGVLAASGTRTANFSAGVLASHSVSVEYAGQFVIMATRTGGAETGRSDTFTVFNPAPTIRGISPALGRRGQDLLVSVSGSGFLQGVTTASFGDRIATSTAVISDTAMVVTVIIDTSAAVGTRDVNVFNGAPGGGVATLPGAFMVVNNPSPTLTSVTPGSGTVLQRLSLVFTGSNFFEGATTVNMGDGIEVDTITVTSSTRLAASVRITGSAAGGTRNVYVSNDPPGGGNSGTKTFQVNAPPTPYPVLDFPPDGAFGVDTVVIFRWNSWLATGVGYWLQISTTPGFDDPVVDDSTIADTSKQIGSLVRGQKYYWRVFARNSVGSSDPSPARSFTPSLEYPATITFSDTVWFPQFGSKAEYRAQDFRLVGIPGNCNVPVRLFLLGEHNVDWVIYWDSGESTNFLVPFDGSATFNFSPGRAFWILNKGLMQIATSVPALPLDSAHCVVIPLHAGWNLIANPFLTTVQWSSVQAANGSPVIPELWGFGGSFSRVSVLMPCTGYLYDNADNRASLRIPFGWSVAKASAAGDPAAWRISIQLTSAEHTDEATSVGISPSADAGRDIMDLRMPRGVGQTPGVYFDRPGWDAGGSVFATDIRKEIEAIQTWPMSVRAAAHEPATLSFSGVQDVPPEYEVLLIDDEHGRAVDLRETPVYAFTPAVPVSKFRMVVGSEESARRVLSDLLPREFALGNNFPNPFNPMTTIPVAVPHSTTLDLSIYSILGEEVQTLFSGALEPGYHWFTWDGTNAAGRTVASGVYLIRLTTEGGRLLTGKMILTK